jgi:aminoglycoside 2''-phosphotransferase
MPSENRRLPRKKGLFSVKSVIIRQDARHTPLASRGVTQNKMDTIEDLIGRIHQAYPDLEVLDVCPFTSDAPFYHRFIINGELVFLFPRSDGERLRLIRETALLKALQGRLPLPIPNPEYLSAPSETAGAPFLGYRALTGTPITTVLSEKSLPAPVFRRIVSQMANFMQALHEIPAASLGIDLPRSETREEVAQMQADIHAKLVPAMRPNAGAWIDRLFEPFLTKAEHFDVHPLLRHGALLGENILIDPDLGVVTGVDDFSQIALGDPALDVACLASISEAFFSDLYQVDPDEIGALIGRAQFYKSTFALRKALAAIEQGDDPAYQPGMAAYLPQSAGLPAKNSAPRMR